MPADGGRRQRSGGCQLLTGLRMGANYAWPRGVTWLMQNRNLAKLSPQR